MNVTLVTNPSADVTFRSRAEACLADCAESPAGLERCLRAEYPKARVSDGIVERGFERWYAYREGHWLGNGEVSEGQEGGSGEFVSPWPKQ